MNEALNKISLISIVLLLLISSCKQETITKNIKSEELNRNDSLVFKRMLDSLLSNYDNSKDELISLSDSIVHKFPDNTAKNNIRIAHLHFNKENYYLARYYFVKASEEFEKRGMMAEYAEQLSNVGVVLEISGFYPQALNRYFEALRIFEKLNLHMKIARVSNNIGIIYQQLNQAEKSVGFYKKALKISEQQANKNVSANSYNNIATYFEEFKHNYDSALIFYKKAQKIYSSTSRIQRLLIIENNIGNNYLLKNELSIADSIFNSVLQKSLDNGFEDRIAPILINQAQLYIRLNKYSEAIVKTEKSLELAVENKNKELELESLSILSEAYEKQNNYKAFSQVIRKQFNLKEKLSGIEQKKQINVLNVKYEVDNKEAQIEILELNNDVKNREIMQLWLLITIIILLSAGGFIVFYLQRKNNKLINTQMRRDIADYINKINEIKTEHKTQQEVLSNNRDTQILEKTKLFDLTERENDVLLLIAKGYKNKKIADTLFVSINTVKYHTKNIFIKLDVKNRIEAVQKAQGL